jgi:hypothetical protein
MSYRFEGLLTGYGLVNAPFQGEMEIVYKAADGTVDHREGRCAFPPQPFAVGQEYQLEVLPYQQCLTITITQTAPSVKFTAV